MELQGASCKVRQIRSKHGAAPAGSCSSRQRVWCRVWGGSLSGRPPCPWPCRACPASCSPKSVQDGGLHKPLGLSQRRITQTSPSAIAPPGEGACRELASNRCKVCLSEWPPCLYLAMQHRLSSPMSMQDGALHSIQALAVRCNVSQPL